MLKFRRHVFALQVVSVQLLRHHAVKLLQINSVLVQVLRRLDKSRIFDQLIGLIVEKSPDFALLLHRVDGADRLLVVAQDVDRVVVFLGERQGLFYMLQFLFQCCVLCHYVVSLSVQPSSGLAISYHLPPPHVESEIPKSVKPSFSYSPTFSSCAVRTMRCFPFTWLQIP